MNQSSGNSGSPFSRISRDVLVRNRWHSYCRDRYVRRDGSEGEYFYVDMPGSAGVIPLFEDGTTVLLRVRRYLLGATLWELPIGGMKVGEDALLVAQHELEEEAGLRAERWERLGSFAPYKGVSNELTHFFLARGLTWTRQNLDAEEEISVHRMRVAEAKEKLLAQEPLDGQSLVGWLLAERSGAFAG